MQFPVSGVDCPVWWPPALAFVVAAATTPAGLSGAFLLVPLQMNVLGFASPAVAPTNLIYNLVAIPGGVYRYIREGRMVWPLAAVLAAGSLPGMLVGAFVRIRYLPDPNAAKLFVGCVLFYVGVRLLWDARQRQAVRMEACNTIPKQTSVRTTLLSCGRVEHEFLGRRFSFGPARVLCLALIAGLVGGIYGIGGGAIIAPYIVGVFQLPAHLIAGAVLSSTLVGSVGGIASFEFLATTSVSAGRTVQPDWTLGLLFGLGGLAGSYIGAYLQRYIPERWIKAILGVLIMGLAWMQIGQYLR